MLEGRIIFGGLGPDGRRLYDSSVLKFTRADGAIVELLAFADEPIDPLFVQKHGLTPIQQRPARPSETQQLQRGGTPAASSGSICTAWPSSRLISS